MVEMNERGRWAGISMGLYTGNIPGVQASPEDFIEVLSPFLSSVIGCFTYKDCPLQPPFILGTVLRNVDLRYKYQYAYFTAEFS